jgi:hypothetical protein
MNLDPAKDSPGLPLDESNSQLIFGRDCYFIKQADLVIVMLTDDISVGGSQEMLIAKYFQKRLMGIVAQGGKFFKSEKEIRDTVFRDWVHPFVNVPCDILVHTIEEAGERLRVWETEPIAAVKDLTIIDDAVTYYETTHLHHENWAKK